MAVNQSRDLVEEMHTGLTEGTYMQLAPMRGGEVEDPRPERLGWPSFARAERDRPRR